MQFVETKLKGAFILDLESCSAQQRLFARTFYTKKFEAHNLKPTVAQCNLSFNYKNGTLRGMHYQVAPATKTKFVSYTQDAIYDLTIDMRLSPTNLSHSGVELTAGNCRTLYVSKLFAHGYQALTDGAEVIYEVRITPSSRT